MTDTSPNILNRRRLLGAAFTAACLPIWGCQKQSLASIVDTPFTTLDGNTSSTASFKQKVVLVNFWATSCSTCVREMPQIIATHNKFKNQGFETLAVAMQYDPPAYVMAFAKSRALPFMVTMDIDGQIAKNFGDVEVTPTTVLLNKEGSVEKRYVGVPDFDAMHVLIEQLLQA